MGVKGHKIERIMPIETFIDMISTYKEGEIVCTEHTFFRLGERQRKLFKTLNVRGELDYDF